ncbi:class I SAM-dependent methyltransferase [Aminobacter sp. MDW-2]|jgi:SAM-dependent methyltransferase
MLDWLVDRTRSGTLCDLGCGPGHVAAYLARRASSVVGIDISPRMVAGARGRYRGITFQQGNMLDLDGVLEATFAGISCFYSIVHLRRDQLRDAFREMHRVLTPQGWLLLAFHVGEERCHVREFLGRTVDLDFQFFLPGEICKALEKAGFTVREALLREPYAGAEVETQRSYIWAQRA